MTPPRPLDTALVYARQGWPVLPLHTIRNRQCSCGDPACRSPGKHPVGELAQHGLKDATTDLATIHSWWSRWPDANIGIATGASSGLVVLDVDPRNGGDDSLAELERECGPLPKTTVSLTGGGGRHVLFRHPGGYVRCRTIRPGLEVKADGGYIVAPWSLHV